MAYKRVLLKLSGEALAGDKKTGFDEDTCVMVGKQIKQLVDGGTQVAIVIGGGNFWRGRSSETIGRVQADQIGMLATVMNCIYVSEILRTLGMKTGIYTQFEIGSVTEVFHMDTVNEALSEGKVVFLAGGPGHPYFSTDTATSLRAIELNCDIILMARAIDGVYDSDPRKNPDAKKFDEITYKEIIDKKLEILDMTASVMCMQNNMPTLLFSLNEENAIVTNCLGKCTGTIIK